jgi:plasmid stabilization system protein ParE
MLQHATASLSFRKPSLYPAELRDRSPAVRSGCLETPYQSKHVIASLERARRATTAVGLAGTEVGQIVETARLLCASPHKIPSLRPDDLLIDRLFQAVEVSLRHAKLHLIFSLLPLESLRCGLAGKSFTARDRHRRGRRVGRRRSDGGRRGSWSRGGLRQGRGGQSDRNCRGHRADQESHGSPPIEATRLNVPA